MQSCMLCESPYEGGLYGPQFRTNPPVVGFHTWLRSEKWKPKGGPQSRASRIMPGPECRQTLELKLMFVIAILVKGN